MATRGPIADGYLDAVFAPRRILDDEGMRDKPPTGKRARIRRSSRTIRSGKAAGSPARKGSPGKVAEIALTPRHIRFVDSIAYRLRLAGEPQATRQQVIHALLEAVEECGLDLPQIESLEELRRVLVNALRSPSLSDIPRATLDVSLKLLRLLTEGFFALLRDRRVLR